MGLSHRLHRVGIDERGEVLDCGAQVCVTRPLVRRPNAHAGALHHRYNEFRTLYLAASRNDLPKAQFPRKLLGGLNEKQLNERRAGLSSFLSMVLSSHDCRYSIYQHTKNGS